MCPLFSGTYDPAAARGCSLLPLPRLAARGCTVHVRCDWKTSLYGQEQSITCRIIKTSYGLHLFAQSLVNGHTHMVTLSLRCCLAVVFF